MVEIPESAAVEEIIRTVGERHVMSHFGRLTDADIDEKTPGDLVTVADRAAERALSDALTELLPGSVVVGEEAVFTDPAVVDRLAGEAPVWVIDPIDGTANYANGSPRFTMLVALAQGGELRASWTYAPALGLMATARAGHGSYVDGRPLRVRAEPGGLRHLDVATPHHGWWTPVQRAQFNALAGHGVALTYFDTSGLEYVELASGRRAAMVLTWEYPWDHAAGLLLHTEAGGVVRSADGSGFRLAGGNALPFVVAADEETADRIQAALAGGPPPLRAGEEAGPGRLDRGLPSPRPAPDMSPLPRG